MSKKATDRRAHGHAPEISKKAYRDSLRNLQVELVKLQRHFIECNDKILIILEGRDASGKDGAIKRIVQHLSPRETRVVALGKPSDRDRHVVVLPAVCAVFAGGPGTRALQPQLV